MSLEGKQAPPFELAGSDGKRHSLREYAGKTVVIYFYPKDNTPGCTKEACGFRDMKQHLDHLGVVLLGVSKDSLKSHDKFIADFELPFVLLSDPDAAMMTAYGAFGEKMQYGKKSMGVIRSTVVVGPDGKVVKQWPNVAKAETHPAAVLEFLLEYLAVIPENGG
jgi:peroxiredoxin Q/BCP